LATIIDRRLNPRDKNIKNRQKFIERAKPQIKKAIKEEIDKGNISDIQIVDVNLKGDRELKLKYTPYRKRVLKNDFRNVLEHLKTLWGYNVTLTM
jgi:spore cortex formation protein SpoVR/YcgB (stage V sporulation)